MVAVDIMGGGNYVMGGIDMAKFWEEVISSSLFFSDLPTPQHCLLSTSCCCFWGS